VSRRSGTQGNTSSYKAGGGRTKAREDQENFGPSGQEGSGGEGTGKKDKKKRFGDEKLQPCWIQKKVTDPEKAERCEKGPGRKGGREEGRKRKSGRGGGGGTLTGR